MALLEAAGASVPEDEVQTFVESDIETFQMFAAGVAIFDEGLVLDLTRVMGNAMARVAEAAISMFQVNVEGPMAARDAGDVAHAEANLVAVCEAFRGSGGAAARRCCHRRHADARWILLRPDREPRVTHR